MTNFSTIGFNYIADTANIICVFPQAVTDQYAGTAWNASAGQYGYFPNTTVNDIGFINALIDTSIANYSIDPTRVYLCGFSMGGFMTERMALQSNSKIAAFGSMSGTFGNGITTFNPGRNVPIAHFHGTADSTVYYTGNLYGMDPDSMIHFWVNNNLCDTPAVLYNYPHVGSDTITIERFEYSNGDPQSDVWFFKMHGAGHTVLYQPTSDMTEIIELWLFFRRHTNLAVGVNDNPVFSEKVQIFPNPCSDYLTINIPVKAAVDIINIEGQLIKSFGSIEPNAAVDISGIAKGMYFIKVKTDNGMTVERFVKE
jgi:polyhydroxybutyrate depolymerase